MKKILDVPVPSSAPSMKKMGKSKLKKTPSGNRMRYSEMISSAVQALKKPKGSSRQAIAKYVQNNFDVPVNSVGRNVTKNLKQMIGNEQLLLTSGVGAAGRFKVNKAVGSQTVPSSAVVKKRSKPKKPASPKKKKVTKKPKRKSPVKKKTAKRTTKKPAKPGKRTSKKPLKKKGKK